MSSKGFFVGLIFWKGLLSGWGRVVLVIRRNFVFYKHLGLSYLFERDFANYEEI